MFTPKMILVKWVSCRCFFDFFVPRLFNWRHNPNLDNIIFFAHRVETTITFVLNCLLLQMVGDPNFTVRKGIIIVFTYRWVLQKHHLSSHMFPRHEGNLSFVAGSPAPWIQHLCPPKIQAFGDLFDVFFFFFGEKVWMVSPSFWRLKSSKTRPV